MSPNRNGYPRREQRRQSAATLPHRLPLGDHQAIGRRLGQVEAGLQALADTLTEAYGKSSELTRYTLKLADSCKTLRGQLPRQLDSEHPLTGAGTRAACYAPLAEDQGT
jgi:hypothetical protein